MEESERTIQLTAAPCMYLETVELLYAWYNHIPAQSICGRGEYCIPPEEYERIRDLVCGEINPEDPELEYFFRAESLRDSSGNQTCIARTLAYSSQNVQLSGLEEYAAALKEGWRRLRENRMYCTTMDLFSFDYDVLPEGEAPRPLKEEFRSLLVSPAYRDRLAEIFGNLDASVARLTALLTPVARRLEPELLPWAAQTEPLLDRWDQYWHSPDLEEKLQKQWSLTQIQECRRVFIGLRYLQSRQAPGLLIELFGTAYFHIGVGTPDSVRLGESMEDWEYKALRLLGSPARVRMLQALRDRAYSSRELARALDLNLGAVCRDMSSMFDARLLTISSEEGHIRYRTSAFALETLSRRLLALRPPKEDRP